MTTRQEALTACRKVIERGEELAGGLSEKDWLKPVYEGGWNVKQAFCHLASVGGAPLYFISLARRPASEGGTGLDVDGWNAEQVNARQDRPIDEIMQEFRNSYEAGIRAVQTAADDTLGGRIPNFEGGMSSVLEMIMGAATEHEMTHLDEIERALRGV